ncbi:MAG: hypothetical protein Q6366_004600 [Candidatus Freyarchaeota archaeon]
MSGDADFLDKLKGELRSFGAITDKGLALLTMKGEVLYSDLTKEVEQKLMLFKPSFPGLTVGSNITLAAENESVIVIRASQQILMAVQTQQRVGLTLVMLSGLIKRYGSKFDEFAQTVTIAPPAIKPTVKIEKPAPAAVIETPIKEMVVKEEAAEEARGIEAELTEKEFEIYQKSLIYELIPPLTPENVLNKSGVWSRASRLMLRNLDQDLTVEELQEGLKNAGFDVTWQWVYETLRALETRGIVRIKGKR